MKSYPTLPQGYVPFATIDLVHNKKQFWIVNGLSVALCVIMLILPFLWGRSLRGFVGEGSLSALLLRLGVVAGAACLHRPARADPRRRDESLRRFGALRL